MTYLPRHFALATAELLSESSADQQREILLSLSKILTKKKLAKHLPKILAAIEQKMVNQKGGRIINIELAQKTEKNESKIKQACQQEDLIKITENKNLIAGVKIIINREYQLDCSLAGRLQKIFS